MDLASLLFLLLMAGLGWFWLNSLSALEVARNAGRQVCGRANLQFLDDTVSSIGLALVRNKYGRRVLRRTYRFEFSETGNTRLEGRLVVLGNKIESVTMEPYQITSQDDALGVANPCDDGNTFTDTGRAFGGGCSSGGAGQSLPALPAAGEVNQEENAVKR